MAGCALSPGSEIDAELARQIAHGTVDPVTREPYPPELLGELEVPPASSAATPLPRQQTRSHDITHFFAAAAAETAETAETAAPPEPVAEDEDSDTGRADTEPPVRRRLDFVVLSRFFALPPPEQLACLCPCEVVCRSCAEDAEDAEDAGSVPTPCKRTRAELDALPEFSYTEEDDEDDKDGDDDDGDGMLNFGDEEKDTFGNVDEGAAVAAAAPPSPPPRSPVDTGTPKVEETAQEQGDDRTLALDSLDMFLCD